MMYVSWVLASVKTVLYVYVCIYVCMYTYTIIHMVLLKGTITLICILFVSKCIHSIKQQAVCLYNLNTWYLNDIAQ